MMISCNQRRGINKAHKFHISTYFSKWLKITKNQRRRQQLQAYEAATMLVQPKKMLIKKYLAIDAKDSARLQVNLDLDFLIWSDRFKFSSQNLWRLWLKNLHCRRKVQKTVGVKLFIGGPVLHPKTVIRFFVECNFVQILGPFSPEK